MKIALIGYGKMGKMIEQIARDRGHEIVSIIDIDNQQDFDSPAFLPEGLGERREGGQWFHWLDEGAWR